MAKPGRAPGEPHVAGAVAAQTPTQVPATERTRDQAQARANAQEQAQARANAQEQAQAKLRDQQICGYPLMTPAERNAYRDCMRAAKTAQERERIRAEHHAEMQVRAKERGVTLPPELPAGRGMGSGPGEWVPAWARTAVRGPAPAGVVEAAAANGHRGGMPPDLGGAV